MSAPERKLVFVTGNRGKLEDVRRIWAASPQRKGAERLPDLEAVALDLPEIQSLDMAQILRVKAQEAYRRIGRPVVVDETSLEIDAFLGFPGPLVKWMLESLGAEGMALATHATAERSGRRRGVTARCAVLVHDPEGELGGPVEVLAEGSQRGILVHPGRGERGFGWDPVFQPDGSGRTRAEMTGEEKSASGHRGKAWRELARLLVG